MENQVIGYKTTEHVEHRFIQWVADCRYGRLELPTRTGVIPAMAGILTAIAGPVSKRLGYPDMVLSFIVAGLFLLLLGAFRYPANAGRRLEKGDEDEWACFEGENGLQPRLFEGERIVGRAEANARIRKQARWAMGSIQVVWGLMLAGLPLATIASGRQEIAAYQFWISGFTTVGTLVIARGVRDLFFLVPVSRWVMTNKRLVAIGGSGIARSLWFDSLIHKPLVVPRSDTKATFALELRRLLSAGMLPMRGLWGVDELPRETAEEWANEVVASRREG